MPVLFLVSVWIGLSHHVIPAQTRRNHLSGHSGLLDTIYPRDAQRDANKQAEKENAEREGNRGYIDVNR